MEIIHLKIGRKNNVWVANHLRTKRKDGSLYSNWINKGFSHALSNWRLDIINSWNFFRRGLEPTYLVRRYEALTNNKDLCRFVPGCLGLGDMDLPEHLMEDPEEGLVILGAEDLGDEPTALVEELNGQFQSGEGQLGCMWRKMDYYCNVEVSQSSGLET